jgi:hypothetical protein
MFRRLTLEENLYEQTLKESFLQQMRMETSFMLEIEEQVHTI